MAAFLGACFMLWGGALPALAQSPPAWTVNPSDFQHTMNITGTLEVDGATVQHEASMLGAFFGDEVRGVGTVQFFSSLNAYLVFLTVYSNVSAGDTLTFRIYDGSADTIYESTTTVPFEADGVKGGINDPIVFSVATGVGVEPEGIPQGFRLEPNYPNPFNPATTIRYTVAQAAHVRLVVYDALGREVQTLVDGVQQPNQYTLAFDAAGLESGLYLYRLHAGAFEQARTMVLLK